VATGIPIDCTSAVEPGSEPFGTELSPAALRDAGLLDAIGAADAGDLAVRLVGQDRDPGTGVLGWPSVLATTQAVRSLAREQITGGRLPFLVGGCCTLLPGALSGARDALGAVGLAYLDGHLDLYDGQTSTTGEPADMPISVITGNGPAAWSADIGFAAPDSEHRRVVIERVAGLEPAGYGSVRAGRCRAGPGADGRSLREQGMAAAGADARDQLIGSAGRYWVHLDVDVLDEQAFPATDYLMPGGLSRDELTGLMGPLLASPALAGLSLACYNPAKDADGDGARYLVGLFRELL
jgi:arginase